MPVVKLILSLGSDQDRMKFVHKIEHNLQALTWAIDYFAEFKITPLFDQTAYLIIQYASKRRGWWVDFSSLQDKISSENYGVFLILNALVGLSGQNTEYVQQMIDFVIADSDHTLLFFMNVCAEMRKSWPRLELIYNLFLQKGEG
jgi:hypothetical protein